MDRNSYRRGRTPHAGPAGTRALSLLGLALLAVSVSGCSLFVMAGKMIFGDPTVTASFKQMTGVNLVKDQKKVVVVCSTPAHVDAKLSSLKIDLLDGVARRLKRNGIQIVNPEEVAAWMDDTGGQWDDFGELIERFEPEIIIHIDLKGFSYQEENSPTLLRGRSTGHVHAYRVQKVGGESMPMQIFESEFNSEYPPLHPVSVQQITEKTFRKQYIDRITDQLAHIFYDHRPDMSF